LYLTGNTSRLHYKAQPVNAVWGNSPTLKVEEYAKKVTRKIQTVSRALLLAESLPEPLFDPDDGSGTFLRNVTKSLPDYSASHSTAFRISKSYCSFLTIYETFLLPVIAKVGNNDLVLLGQKWY
jgi:hypothetical protein